MNKTIKKTAAGLMAACMIILTACGEKSAEANTGTQATNTPAATVPGTTETSQTDKVSYKVLKLGDEAPDFTATLRDGSTFTLSDHKEEVVLINFWATWCPPCVAELPDFEKLVGDNIDNFTLIAVNCMEDEKTVDDFIEKNGYTFNVAYDPEDMIGMKYPTDGIPYTVIVKNGIIKKIYLGRNKYDTFKKVIEENLDK